MCPYGPGRQDRWKGERRGRGRGIGRGREGDEFEVRCRNKCNDKRSDDMLEIKSPSCWNFERDTEAIVGAEESAEVEQEEQDQESGKDRRITAILGWYPWLRLGLLSSIVVLQQVS
jgi:hypothetical protein